MASPANRIAPLRETSNSSPDASVTCVVRVVETIVVAMTKPRMGPRGLRRFQEDGIIRSH
jgi:hypothetical protein